MARLDDKVALVTGASRGIGAAIARRLGGEGAAVAVVYRTDPALAEEVVGDITAAGGKAQAFHCDVSRTGDITAMAEAVIAEFGGVDILVNNAGIYLLNVLGETPEDIWDRQMDTNLKGAFFTAEALLPQMKARGGGKIINIGSICGETGMLSSSVYCATKGGIKLMTKAMALDLRGDNIQVNSLSPGCVETDMNTGYRAEGESFFVPLQERFGPGDPWMQPDDMAGTALFLASSDSDRVTGANIMVDHGYSAY
jgi:NAD(P)-dependent dehydrogenase (short-subunit alcohol dehydrogenase family)